MRTALKWLRFLFRDLHNFLYIFIFLIFCFFCAWYIPTTHDPRPKTSTQCRWPMTLSYTHREWAQTRSRWVGACNSHVMAFLQADLFLVHVYLFFRERKAVSFQQIGLWKHLDKNLVELHALSHRLLPKLNWNSFNTALNTRKSHFFIKTLNVLHHSVVNHFYKWENIVDSKWLILITSIGEFALSVKFS